MKTILNLFVLILLSSCSIQKYTKSQVIEFGKSCYYDGFIDGYTQGFFVATNECECDSIIKSSLEVNKK